MKLEYFYQMGMNKIEGSNVGCQRASQAGSPSSINREGWQNCSEEQGSEVIWKKHCENFNSFVTETGRKD